MLELLPPFTPCLNIGANQLPARGDTLLELRTELNKKFKALSRAIEVKVEANPDGYWVFFGNDFKHTRWLSDWFDELHQNEDEISGKQSS